MNCLNCGAPMELAEGRTILTCEYCNSTRRLECDSDDEDRVISLERPAEFVCPRCQHQLVEAALDGHPVSYCSECRGILLENAIFAEVSRNRRAAFRGTEFQAQPIDPSLLQESISCPRCMQTMDVHPNYGPGQAVIDSCYRCELVWLDNSEITNIERTPGCR